MKHILLLVFMLTTAIAGKAQIGALPQVKLANIDTTYASYTQILAYPKLVTGMPNCEVTEFTITFTIKDGATYGPYPTRGNMLTDDEKIIIKNIRTNLVKVKVDNISMRCDGQLVQGHSFSLWMGY